MTDPQESQWRIEEEFAKSGGRRVFVRAADLAALGEDIEIQVSRSAEPPFMTDEGWAEEARPIKPRSVEIDGRDLLIELGTEYTDEIEDFEAIELQISGTSHRSALPWVMEPISRLPKPFIKLSVSRKSVQVGEAVYLAWEAQNVEGVTAAGAWMGERDLVGEETVVPDAPGDYEFTLSSSDKSQPISQSVVVSVTAPGATAQPKPMIKLSASRMSVPLGEPVHLSWEAEDLEGLEASGAWKGRRELVGQETVMLDAPGSHVFRLDAAAASGPISESIFVTVKKKAFPLWALFAGGFALLLVLALVYFLMFRGEKDASDPAPPNPTPEDHTQQPEPRPDPDPLNPVSSPLDPAPADENSIDRLRRLIQDKQFDDDAAGNIGARNLLKTLAGQGNPEAALIGAKAAQGPGFQPGLFEQRSDRQALQYYRLACTGGAGARSDLTAWRAQLESEFQGQPSESARDMVNIHIPELLKTCQD